MKCMNYREIIADNLKKAGWSLGYVSAVDCATGERSGLQTRIAVTEGPTRCSDQKGRSR